MDERLTQLTWSRVSMTPMAPALVALAGVLFSGAFARLHADDPALRPGKPSAQPPSKASSEEAVLAGGCFWGMQDILRKIPGVIDTKVGYAGGTTAHPTYDDVRTGKTGHAEAVRVQFDPRTLSYEDLLEKWFFRMHDPTTKNRQGNDRGTQYRSAILVASPEQRRVAELVKRRVDESGKWKAPIVTEIVDATAFTLAEAEHQDYLKRNPGGYSCHYLRK
jgi:methionine-S-sulfoxide reductase